MCYSSKQTFIHIEYLLNSDEQIIKFTYVEESAAIGVYKQKVNSDGSKTYDDVKLENTVYF